MKQFLLLIVFIFSICVSQAQKLLTPKEFLGYELGDRFTQHYRVLEYFKHVADVMPTVEVRQYGETYEHRPLIYAVVSSAENLQNVEELRINNLRRAGMMEGSPTG